MLKTFDLEEDFYAAVEKKMILSALGCLPRDEAAAAFSKKRIFPKFNGKKFPQLDMHNVTVEVFFREWWGDVGLNNSLCRWILRKMVDGLLTTIITCDGDGKICVAEGSAVGWPPPRLLRH